MKTKVIQKPLMFTKAKQIIVLLVTTLLCFGCAVKSVVSPSDVLDPKTLSPTLQNILQHGDWLVVRGTHTPDNMVATVTNMPLSHAGIYDAAKQEVIEADGSGVHTRTLDAFLSTSIRILVIRPMWSNEETAAKAVARARGWIGKGYDFSGLIGLNLKDRFYCTELAMLSYQPFIQQTPENPIPPVIAPGQMYHWGRILFDSGPVR